MRPVRVAHVVSHPIQYFAPLYRELAFRPEIDLTVYFCSDETVREYVDPGFGRPVRWDTPLLDGYRSRFCGSARGASIAGGMRRRPNVDVAREIGSGRYDVLWVHGYAHPTIWLAVAAARLRGTRVLVRDEQTLLHPRSLVRRAIKSVALRALYSQSSALYIGEENRAYFAHYGMPEERMFAARYCVDNAHFRRVAADLALRREEIRRSFGIDDDAPVILFSGKLIEKKQPLMLIEAFERLRRTSDAWLLIVGDGPLRADAEAMVAGRRIEKVRFAGFLNQGELPAAYVAADVFALPSKLHETWGLVVNEAMACGLPVVVSDKVGCARDLVHAGRNGFVVAHDRPDELARALAALVADGDLRSRFGAESRRIIEGYSIESAADGIVAACVQHPAQQIALRAA